MNIFNVLSQGRSKLHEPAISAMLGYLLGTRCDHGLGDSFLRRFLEILNSKISSPILNSVLGKAFIDTEIALEEPYKLRDSQKNIDIQITLLGDNGTEDVCIIIENKIKASAANPKQLQDYYDAILEDDSEIKNLIVVFLTPEKNSSALRKEYDALAMQEGHQKAWLHWDRREDSILTAMQSVLEMEMKAEITPVNEYMRHTLKAFSLHIRSIMPNKSPQTGGDIGEIVEDIQVQVDRQEYRIVRRNSGQIQVFLEGEKVMAKDVLRSLIEERKLYIPKTGINTQRMGKKVLDALRSSKKDSQSV